MCDVRIWVGGIERQVGVQFLNRRSFIVVVQVISMICASMGRILIIYVVDLFSAALLTHEHDV